MQLLFWLWECRPLSCLGSALIEVICTMKVGSHQAVGTVTTLSSADDRPYTPPSQQQE